MDLGKDEVARHRIEVSLAMCSSFLLILFCSTLLEQTPNTIQGTCSSFFSSLRSCSTLLDQRTNIWFYSVGTENEYSSAVDRPTDTHHVFSGKQG